MEQPKNEAKTTLQAKKIILPTNRGLIKCIFLSIITIGIYAFVFNHKYSRDLNVIRKSYNNKTKMGFIAAFFLGFVTLEITMIVWTVSTVIDTYKYADRENVSSGSPALYFVFTILLSWTIVCPFIAEHKLYKTMNNICKVYNSK